MPLALLLAAGLATTLKWGTEPRLRFLVESVALFYLTVATCRTRPDARYALAVTALVALALSTLPGVAQIAQDQATGFYRDGCRPLTVPPPAIPPGTLTRATGSFSNPNLLAGHILLLAPLAAFAVAGLGRRRRAEAAALGLAVALGYLALGLTYSRSAIFFGLLALAGAAALAPVRRRRLVAGVAVGLALASSVAFAACGSDAGSGYGRTQEWRDTIAIALDHPLLGVGLGRVGDVLRAEDPRATTQHAHDLFLNWWAEAGPLALVAWIWILGLLVWRSARFARGDPLAIPLFAALVGFTGFSLFDHPANADRVATALWIVLGLAAAEVGVRAGVRGRARTRSSGPSSRAA